MFNKKIIAVVLSVLCFAGCSGNNDASQTIAEETTKSTSETTVAITTTTNEIIVDEENDIVILPEQDAVEDEFETTAIKNNTGNHEDGLVYFVQPSITLYPRYKQLDDWECRDSEVLRDYHYDREWNYCKELIFAFSNFNDEPVTIDNIQIIRNSDGEPMKFTDGSDALNIDFTVQSLHKTDYLLEVENFDYFACESGVYTAVANFGTESYTQEFYINNCELYSEKHIHENYWKIDDDGNMVFSEYDVFAPTFLTEEQQHIFAQAHGVMSDWFWCSSFMRESYRSTHTPDDFMQLLYSVFTEEYANELSKIYIDENGNYVDNGGDRGSNICYFDHCFIPVSADENTVEFKAVVTYCHSDNPYEVSFDDNFHYVMKNTENGWRVDRFDVWN